MTDKRMKRNEYAKMLKDYPELIRIEQLCETLGGISTKTGYKLLKEKRLQALKSGENTG